MCSLCASTIGTLSFPAFFSVACGPSCAKRIFQCLRLPWRHLERSSVPLHHAPPYPPPPSVVEHTRSTVAVKSCEFSFFVFSPQKQHVICQRPQQRTYTPASTHHALRYLRTQAQSSLSRLAQGSTPPQALKRSCQQARMPGWYQRSARGSTAGGPSPLRLRDAHPPPLPHPSSSKRNACPNGCPDHIQPHLALPPFSGYPLLFAHPLTRCSPCG